MPTLQLMPNARRLWNLLVLPCLVAATLTAWTAAAAPTVLAQAPDRKSDQNGPAQPDEVEQLRQSVRKLTAEVARLKAENAKLEHYKQVDYLREQLMKEEQRVEGLQKELADMAAKETALQKRLDEIEPQLQPRIIEQSRAGIGSTKPEEDRAAIQKQLADEKQRIQAQLDQLKQNRPRLQNAIATADASIVTLRQRLSEAVRAAGLHQ